MVALLPAALGLGACEKGEDGPNDEDAVGAPDSDSDSDSDAPDDDDDPDEDEDGDEPSGPPPAPKPSATALCSDAAWGGEVCQTEAGLEGTRYCILVDGEEFHTPCSTEQPECEPGDNFDQGCLGSICYWDGERFRGYDWSEPDCVTPLVVNFDGAPIEFMPAVAASFDLSTDGTCTSTDWPTAPWLALDRDGDGAIRSGAELFGSATKMSTGGFAEHGFAALAELDSNRDGRITAADRDFARLMLWSDLDDDRVGTPAELRPLGETTVVAIDLGFVGRAGCDGHGNCGFERASFEFRRPDGAVAVGEVVDVHVACR